MRYIIYILLLLSFACSSTVTGGADEGTAGAAGSDTAQAGSASGGSTAGAGGEPSAGSGSSSASGGTNGIAGSAGAAASCTSTLPTNFAWAVDAANGYIAACYYCVDSPCWTAELSWDESTLHFDEYASTITVTVNIHSSGSIRINRSGTSCSGSGICSLSVPDMSFVSTLKVARVSNGYQIIETDKYTQWDAVQEGSCTNIGLIDIELSINQAWHDALYGIVLPCVS